ncbi:hypothetical protein BFW87_23970 [Pseudomonas fluorescens]|uniref:Uncharacterized protein n=1 Tax=Pseudomonas fluorescens TaxID=294 RepID=A0A1T2Y5T0_PSEFL|nr:hypothetical protein [Pseudomonas fluorescens]OPA87500.1 hypothetical protein BFW87_23970 [Pseudomonas fluorescens]
MNNILSFLPRLTIGTVKDPNALGSSPLTPGTPTTTGNTGPAWGGSATTATLPTAPASAQTATPDASSSDDAQLKATLAGKNTQLPTPDEQAPPGMTAADIGKLSKGLLDNLGDQNLQGKGKLPDLLAKDPNVNGDIKNDPNAAWRAYKVLTAVKNETNSDGSPKPDSVITSGKIGGWTKQGFGHGSEGGDLQDYLLHGRVPSQLPKGDHTVGPNGQTASGIQNVGNSIKEGFEKFGKAMKTGFENFGHAVVNIGKDIGNGLKNFGSMVVNGVEGIGDAITGNKSGASNKFHNAHSAASGLGHDITDAGKNLGTVAETLAPLAVALIPGVGEVAAPALFVGEAAAEVGATAAIDVGVEAGAEAGSTAVSQAVRTGAQAIGKEIGKNAGENLAQDIADPNQSNNSSQALL